MSTEKLDMNVHSNSFIPNRQKLEDKRKYPLIGELIGKL